jgi:hypothetical protein
LFQFDFGFGLGVGFSFSFGFGFGFGFSSVTLCIVFVEFWLIASFLGWVKVSLPEENRQLIANGYSALNRILSVALIEGSLLPKFHVSPVHYPYLIRKVFFFFFFFFYFLVCV